MLVTTKKLARSVQTFWQNIKIDFIIFIILKKISFFLDKSLVRCLAFFRLILRVGIIVGFNVSAKQGLKLELVKILNRIIA